MSEILQIINENLGPKNFNKKSFKGNVYFQNRNGLDIDRSIYNRLLNKFNSAFDLEEGDLFTTNDDLLLVFVNEVFEDNSDNWLRMDRNYYMSSVITDWGLFSMWSEETKGSDKKPDVVFAQPWEDIDFVELFEQTDGGYLFRFYEKDKTEQFDLNSNRFGTFSLIASKKILNVFNEIIEYKRQNATNSINEHAELKTKIEKSFNDGNYKEAVDQLVNFSNVYNVDDITLENSFFYYCGKTTSLLHLGQFDEALTTIETFIKKCEDANQIEAYPYELKGEILLKKNKHLSAINCLAFSEENCEDESNKEDTRLLKEEAYSKLKEVFLEIPYNERKLIFVGEDIYATKSNELVVLKKNDLPINVNFPINHPHLNQVYTCHPHKQNFYLPLKNYSDELFLDRINEFSYLLQCLGATNLDISSSKSNMSDRKSKSKNEIDVDASVKINKAKVNIKGEKEENTSVDLELKIAKKQYFKPVKTPYVPTNLVWYPSDLNWQRLVDQRLNGNIMTHSELMSSSQSENISSHELTKIDVELKLLLPKIGVKYNSEDEISTSSIKKHEWLVTVEFEDIDKLTQLEQNSENILSISDNATNDESDFNLEKYKEDVLFMIEDDGVIDDSERKFLDRKIKKYGLTEDDARAIENELLTLNYSENELKYIEELKEMLEDGGISDVERKLLNRIALKLKINDEIQKKIDSLYIF